MLCILLIRSVIQYIKNNFCYIPIKMYTNQTFLRLFFQYYLYYLRFNCTIQLILLCSQPFFNKLLVTVLLLFEKKSITVLG